MDKSILILGVGNILWADEGFGVRCVEQLAGRYAFADNVTLMDGGTQGVNLMGPISSHSHVLLFDAVDFKEEPTTLIQVNDADIPSFFSKNKMSLHQMGVSEILAALNLLGQYPKAMSLIGIQPQLLEDFGGSLTNEIKTQIPKAIEMGLEQLTSWGVSYKELAGDEVVEPLLFAGVRQQDFEEGRPSSHKAYRKGDVRFLNDFYGKG
ncbi:MAG: HyaD/HybD family hydrogenase maturation endopeptidase [Alphaproteobacteria bacterium]